MKWGKKLRLEKYVVQLIPYAYTVANKAIPHCLELT